MLQARKIVEEQEIAEPDRLRANLYRLLARLFAAPPDGALLSTLAELDGDRSELGQAIGALAATASETDPAAVSKEFQNLFIGIGRGELVPYGSYYLTGFLNEKPLARLREDMSSLEIERADGTKEPEDHIAALMEMMAGLIEGAFGVPAAPATQREFFGKHIASWAPHFFSDLEKTETAQLYRPAGTIGRLFMGIEAATFEM